MTEQVQQTAEPVVKWPSALESLPLSLPHRGIEASATYECYVIRYVAVCMQYFRLAFRMRTTFGGRGR